MLFIKYVWWIGGWSARDFKTVKATNKGKSCSNFDRTAFLMQKVMELRTKHFFSQKFVINLCFCGSIIL